PLQRRRVASRKSDRARAARPRDLPGRRRPPDRKAAQGRIPETPEGAGALVVEEGPKAPGERGTGGGHRRYPRRPQVAQESRQVSARRHPTLIGRSVADEKSTGGLGRAIVDGLWNGGSATLVGITFDRNMATL